jgi:hypothetical protein
MCHSVITIPDHTDIRLCHLHHTKLRKWKFIFLNICQCKGPISTTEEFLNLCQDGTNASMCLGDYAEQQVHFRAIRDNTWHLTLSDPTSNLARQYDFPVLLWCQKMSDTVFVAFVRPLSEPVLRFSSCSTDFSQQIAQVVLFLFLYVYLF